MLGLFHSLGNYNNACNGNLGCGEDLGDRPNGCARRVNIIEQQHGGWVTFLSSFLVQCRPDSKGLGDVALPFRRGQFKLSLGRLGTLQSLGQQRETGVTTKAAGNELGLVKAPLALFI